MVFWVVRAALAPLSAHLCAFWIVASHEMVNGVYAHVGYCRCTCVNAHCDAVPIWGRGHGERFRSDMSDHCW